MGLSDKILKGEKKEIAIAANILIKTGDKLEIEKLIENLHSANNFSQVHIKKVLQVHGDKNSVQPLFNLLLKELETKDENGIKNSSLTFYLISRRVEIKDIAKAKKIIEYIKEETLAKKYLYLLIGVFGKEEEGNYLAKVLLPAPEDEKSFIVKSIILTGYSDCINILKSQEINILKESVYEILQSDSLTNFLIDNIRNLGESFLSKIYTIIKDSQPKNSRLFLKEIIKDTNSPLFNDFLELTKTLSSEEIITTIEELLNSKRKDSIEKALFSTYISLKGEASINLILGVFPHKSSIIQTFVLNEYFSKFKNTFVNMNLSYKIRDIWLKLFKISEDKDLKVAVLKSFKFLTFEKEEDYIFVKGELLSHFKRYEELMDERIKNNIGIVLKAIQKKVDAIHFKKVLLKEIDKYIDLYKKERNEQYLKSLADKITEASSEDLDRDYRAEKEKYFMELIRQNLKDYNVLENSLKILKIIGTKESISTIEQLANQTEFYGIKVLLPEIVNEIRLREGLPQKLSFIFENLFYLKKLIKEGLEKYGFNYKEIDKISMLLNLENRFHSIFIDMQNIQNGKQEIIDLIEKGMFIYYIIIFSKEEELSGLPSEKIIKLKKPFSKEKVENLIEEILT